MKIQYPVVSKNSEKPLPYVYLNLPYEVAFGMHKTVPEYKDEILNELGIQIGTIFDIINHFGFLLVNDECRSDTVGEFIITLTRLGKSLEQGLDMVRERFDEAQDETPSNPKEKANKPLKAVA